MSDRSRNIYEFFKGPSNPILEKGGGVLQENPEFQQILELSAVTYQKEMEDLQKATAKSLEEITTPRPTAFELSEEEEIQIAKAASLEETPAHTPKAATGISGFLKTGNLSNLLTYSSKKDFTINELIDVKSLEENVIGLLNAKNVDEYQVNLILSQISAYYESKHSRLVAIHEKTSQYPGIENIANSCYQNTIYQILSCIPEIRNHVCVDSTKTFRSLVNNLNVVHNPNVSKQEIIVVLKDLHLYNIQFNGVRQQDAGEFLIQLFNRLHDYSKDFSFITNKQLKCITCNDIKTNIFETSLIYEIAIDPTKTDLILQNMIDSDTMWQEPDLTAESFCKTCKKDTVHSEKVTLQYPRTTYKQYLLLYLKRSNFQNEKKLKYENPITVNQKLHINNQDFDLCAIGVHVGSPDGGHWYAYKKINAQWVYCNDSITKNIVDIDMEADLHLGTIYCYQKRNSN